MTLRILARPALTVSLLFAAVAPVSAQDTLQAAQSLYASAAYDEALALLDRLQGSQPSPQEARSIHQNRALCLLALGRGTDAERAIEAAVQSDPAHRPDDISASPRVRQAFRDVRTRVLPGLIQQRYDAAKAAYDRKEFGPAAVGFHEVVALLVDPDLPAQSPGSPLADLKMLADGFRQLSETAAAPPPPPAPEPPAPKAAVAEAVPADRIFDQGYADVVPPVTVRQDVPRWPTASIAAPRGEGILELIIDATGEVESSNLTKPLHPIYDRQLLMAARTWRYQPATRHGVAVRFRKLIRISFAN
jgi:TonB family protein